jgi:hypothetical protein
LDVNVRESDFVELGRHPVRAFGIGRGADDPAPILRMSLVAVATRDLDLLHDILEEMPSIDVAVRLRPRW